MLINIGRVYIKAEEIQEIEPIERGTEEDKRFGIAVYTTDRRRIEHLYEGRTERKEMITKILKHINSPSEELIEIRKQLTNINARLNQIEKKLKALQ